MKRAGRVRDAMKTDVTVSRSGGLFVFTPETRRASRWFERNLVGENTWIGDALVVEGHRYAVPLAEGLVGAGLVVR